jgi:transcriptional regulator with XRE-family HTH domain
MPPHLNDLFRDVENFFAAPPTVDQKAWGMINEFYHLVLTSMEQEEISKADLARRLGKSRAAITQMFHKTPNITIKKMIEIADAIGLDLHISASPLQEGHKSVSPLRSDHPAPVDDLYLPQRKQETGT